MRILIIGFAKLAYMPYMNFYLEQLANSGNEIHVLVWNRDCKDDILLPYSVTVHEFALYQEDEVAKITKIKSFVKYRKFAKTLIKKEGFDFIVVLHTLPGVLIYDLLKKKYKNRYILDYRDFTFENISFFKKIIHGLVKNSVATFVSSDAFRKYLPVCNKIHTSHNLLIDSLNHRENRRTDMRDISPIRIGFWGFIRHEKINLEIIKRLANDPRFELHYYGREQETARNLKTFCSQNAVFNVFFHGEYVPTDRYVFVKCTDIINNLCDNDDMATAMAMGNKYYDGIIFYLPQLCNEGSFMSEMITRADVGLSCNPYSNTFADDVYKYYRTLDWQAFEQKCDTELRRVLDEYESGKAIIAGQNVLIRR